MMNLEATLNHLDIELEKVEAEPIIERCLELGFLPWDNAKFQVFLHWYVQANLSCRGDHRFMRGLLTARFLAETLPDAVDADIAQDIRLWANLEGYERLGNIAAQWPANTSQQGFGIRLERHMDHHAQRLLRLRAKNLRRQLAS